MRTTVLWTGGKDSALACYKTLLAGHEVVNLLTFVPEGADFLAHPMLFLKYQSQAIGLPHYEQIVTAPLEHSYEEAIKLFKEKFEIDALITGDIAQVDGAPNWIRQRCADLDIEVMTPLWGADRYKSVSELISYGFKARISCVKKGSLTEDWLGRDLDEKALDNLNTLNKKTGIDICGEQGEYHTLVYDGPIFRKRIAAGYYSTGSTDSVIYKKPCGLTLIDKVMK